MLGDFEALVEEHRDRVYSLACYLLGDREEAADVTQEVLLRLWRNIDELDVGRDGNVTAWLLRVTRNHCFDLMRKRRSQRSALGHPDEPEAAERAPAAGPTRSASPRAPTSGASSAARSRSSPSPTDPSSSSGRSRR
jgi:RNA polymerase sigma factor (sigma-70 family)